MRNTSGWELLHHGAVCTSFFCVVGTLGSGDAKQSSVHTPVRPSVTLRISKAGTDSGEA
jgi:hypothetical protein